MFELDDYEYKLADVEPDGDGCGSPYSFLTINQTVSGDGCGTGFYSIYNGNIVSKSFNYDFVGFEYYEGSESYV